MQSATRFRYSNDAEEDWLRSTNKHLPVEEASIKKLINDEMSRRHSSRQNGPSIVARLMGMDVLPLDTKLALHPIKKREEPTRARSFNNEKNLRNPVVHRYSSSNCFEYEFDPMHDDSTSSKLKRREHPQEEELQKFKKEFEAWQAARFKECSRYAEIENTSSWATNQKSLVLNKLTEPKTHRDKVRSSERSYSHSHGEKTEIYPAWKKELSSLPCSRIKHQQDEHIPTKIVVLKPGPDKIWSSEESWTSFSGSSEERGSIEDFLEEVKERLKHEIQGKIQQKDPIVPRNRVGSAISEKPKDLRKMAKEISCRVRESVTGDLELGPILIRSESMRSHRSDTQLNDMSSPEFITRDTRKFLAERLTNALQRESNVNVSSGFGSKFSRSSFLSEEKIALQKHDEVDTFEEEQEEEMHARSFRDESLSPKNLVRSLSAPVSGTSFGKLLLEDPHVITGAHIRRKHEHSIENLLAGTKKGRKEKEKFSLWEKVYNFRSTFTLRGRLFGRRMQSMADLRTCEPGFMKDIMNGPTVILNRGESYENSTEVPPSPASFCSSSAPEEFWRPSNDISPVSSPEATSRENSHEPRVSGEITSNHSEVQRQQNQSNSDSAVEGSGEEEAGDCKLPELEDGQAAYIRALLVASGMYDGQSDSLWRLDPLAKQPITTSIYEEVEESCKQHPKEEAANNNSVEKGIENDHRVLCDLLKEALSNMLRPPLISARFRKNIPGTCDPHHIPDGNRLMDLAWGFISPLVYPPKDVSSYYSLDSMVARELGSAPIWSTSMDEQVDALGAEIEGSILGDLIGEIMRDIKLR